MGIPSVFSINSELKITNLKRTIISPSLIFKSQCHIECEKWNEEGDYYGFVRIKCIKNKTKYYSGGGYGTKGISPHDECPEGSAYGDDCMENNYLYYGSPSFDDGELV